MNKYKNIYFLFCLQSLLFLFGCTSEKGIPSYNDYPDDIGRLVFTKCATPGCHNEASKGAAAGLSLESWDKLFEGGTGSAAVIPYSSEFSTLFAYTNTFSDLGLTLLPTMPYNNSALSREDVLMIKNWINAGAPSRDGRVKFADDSSRKKFYVANQGCDVVTVFDQETFLPMRYISVGNDLGIESPHMIKVSPDGAYWYIVSLQGNSLQKYRTSDDSFVGEAILGVKNWNTFSITSDGQKAFAIDWSANGDIAEINLTTLSVQHNIGFNYPHGSYLNGDTLYVTQQTGSSKLYKIPINDFSSFSEIDLFTTPPTHSLDAHELIFSPDGTKYFVTCQGTNEVRVFDKTNDALLSTLAVGALPSEMAVSVDNNYLFVTCPEDTVSFVGKRGAVWVIDINTNAVIKAIYTGHQPHGIAVDDAKNMVYVANRNATSDGPAPHHSGTCGGRNGYVSFIDMSSLTMFKQGANDKKVEVSVDPYSVALRP
jgi:YVTN family beta-propeller protein